MRTPQLGHIVLYRSEVGGEQQPAIVLKVYEEDPADIRLKLTVFLPSGITGLRTNVAQGMEPGQWQWHDIPIS